MIRREAFVFSLWRVRLFKEVLEPVLITNEMYHLLSIIYYLQYLTTLQRYKNNKGSYLSGIKRTWLLWADQIKATTEFKILS